MSWECLALSPHPHLLVQDLSPPSTHSPAHSATWPWTQASAKKAGAVKRTTSPAVDPTARPATVRGTDAGHVGPFGQHLEKATTHTSRKSRPCYKGSGFPITDESQTPQISKHILLPQIIAKYPCRKYMQSLYSLFIDWLYIIFTVISMLV